MKLTWFHIMAIAIGLAVICAAGSLPIFWHSSSIVRWAVICGLVGFVFGFLWAFSRRDPDARLRWYVATLIGSLALICVARASLGFTLDAHVTLPWLTALLGLGNPPWFDAIQLLCGVILAGMLVFYAKNRPAERDIAPEIRAAILVDIPPLPPLIKQTPLVFWERVQALFQNRAFSSITLTYDRDTRCLTGTNTSSIHGNTTIIVCCHNSDDTVTHEEINRLHHLAPRMNAKLFFVVQTEAVLPASVRRNHPTIQFRTEAELLDELVDFEPYLHSIITAYEKDPLPFSTRVPKPTLGETYITPRFTLGDRGDEEQAPSPGNIVEHLDEWLRESSWRHTAITGDYGMGKSSLVLHYAYKLAQVRLATKKGRIPLRIALTGMSPRTDPDNENLLSALIKRCALGCNTEALRLLMKYERVVLLLDGFDEIDLVGDAQLRYAHFENLWKLAFFGNKILISGRAGYFPTSSERRKALHLNLDRCGERPFCEEIKLLPFSKVEIRQSFDVYFSPQDAITNYNFVAEQAQLLDLATRPALTQMIRETIALVQSKYKSVNITATDVLKIYVERWTDREEKKERVLLVENEQRRRFMMEVALVMFKERRASVSREIFEEIATRNLPSKPHSAEWLAGVITDLRTCSFLVPIDDSEDLYQFAHKSFFEYFAACGLLTDIDNGGARLSEPLSREICSHIGNLIHHRIDKSRNEDLRQKICDQLLAKVDERTYFQICVYAKIEISLFVSYARHQRIFNPASWFRDAWRSKDILSDLSNLDLRGLDFQGMRLTQTNFIGSNLEGADFSHCDLRMSVFREVKACGATFAYGRLMFAEFGGADLRNVTFTHSDLRGASLGARRWDRIERSERTPLLLLDLQKRLQHLRLGDVPLGVLLAGRFISSGSILSWYSRFIDFTVIARLKLDEEPAIVEGTDFTGAKIGGLFVENVDLTRVKTVTDAEGKICPLWEAGQAAIDSMPEVPAMSSEPKVGTTVDPERLTANSKLIN